MDASELEALLKAAARELISVVEDLHRDDEHEASSACKTEITEARKIIENVAALCCSSPMHGISCMNNIEQSEVFCEARSLRDQAVRARDVAEANLLALQDEHTEMLEHMHKLSLQQRQCLEEQRAEVDHASAREAALVERCEQLDCEVRALRRDVDAKNKCLIASSTLGHSLELNKRRLQRQHEGSLIENAIAKEILNLQQSTEAYLHHANAACIKVDQDLEAAHKRCAEKMEGLQSELCEQKMRYESDVATLQTRLLDLQTGYEERWRSTEKNARQVIDGKSQKASEARQTLEQEIQRLDEEWEREAIASRALVEEQNRRMADARQLALAEMETKLGARQRDMEEQANIQRRRCESQRNHHVQKAVNCRSEVIRYKKYINDLNLGYRRKPKRRYSTPRSNGVMVAGGASPDLTDVAGAFE